MPPEYTPVENFVPGARAKSLVWEGRYKGRHVTVPELLAAQKMDQAYARSQRAKAPTAPTEEEKTLANIAQRMARNRALNTYAQEAKKATEDHEKYKARMQTLGIIPPQLTSEQQRASRNLGLLAGRAANDREDSARRGIEMDDMITFQQAQEAAKGGLLGPTPATFNQVAASMAPMGPSGQGDFGLGGAPGVAPGTTDPMGLADLSGLDFSIPGADGGGNGGGNKMICGALYDHGLLDSALYTLDRAYGQRLWQFDPEVMIGYHRWALPIAALMQEHRWLAKLIYPLALPWARYLATGRGIGALYQRLGVPVCRWLGRRRAEKITQAA